MCDEVRRTQKTDEGYEIPVPKREEFFDDLKQIVKPVEEDENSTPDNTEEE